MSEYTGEEKRRLPRLLCDDFFSETSVETSAGVIQVDSINYNYLGIRLFSIDRIPELGSALFSFFHTDGNEEISIVRLKGNLVYARETEVGNQYGVRFDVSNEEDVVKKSLRRIHDRLSQQQVDGRYNLDY